MDIDFDVFVTLFFTQILTFTNNECKVAYNANIWAFLSTLSSNKYCLSLKLTKDHSL